MIDQKISDAINSLYLMTEVSPPTIENCITPLSELINRCNGLICKEVSRLTSQAAINYLLKQGGLMTVPDAVDVNREPLAGYLYATPNFGSIFVEQSDFVVRRRFTIAHELGHFLIHRPLLAHIQNEDEQFFVESFKINEVAPEAIIESEDLPFGQVTINRSNSIYFALPTFEEMEREANLFAAELLIPKTVIKSLIKTYVPDFQDDDLVWRLASDMFVSRAAMRLRLRNLNLLPPSTVQLN